MVSLPPPIAQLIGALSQWPGIGPRSAERIALYLVQSDPNSVSDLARAILSARDSVSLCQICGALTERQPCVICCDPKRDASVICVVERPVDIFSIEKAESYRGKFHVLGGKISPLNGIGPEDLRISALEERLGKEPVQEIIVALPSDVEGDATSSYLAKLLSTKPVKISRIAHGLPVGSGLEFTDALTLSRAIEGRRPLS